MAAIALCVSLVSACAQYENRRGVDVKWQSAVTGTLVRGESTRADVLDLLGPPSQVISLDDETVLWRPGHYHVGWLSEAPDRT